MTNTKETAKQIRKELKEKFPFTKFSVRCSRGSSITVSWDDFPTEKAVEEIISKYEKVDRCPVTGDVLGGGNLFVFTRQTWSEELKKKIETEVRNNYGESYLNDRACYYRAFNETAEKLYNEFLQTLETKQEQQTNVKATYLEDVDNNGIEETKPLQVSYKINDEKNGIELYFSDKPNEVIREQLKQMGFRWSRLGFWYAKKTDERLNFVQSLLSDSYNSQEVTYPDINIDDIDTYVIDERLQEAEHAASWIFRTQKRDHTKEIQELFTQYNRKVIDLLEQTDDERIIYNLKKALQSFKKRYFENYIKILRHRSENPSWVVTGRGGLNKHRYDKALSRYDKLIQESIELIKQIDAAINKAKNKIQKEKRATYLGML